ncbi:MAG: response regulator [Phycisphaera sp.]|nr:response regulator [Phycisphaera sp.]
MPRQSHGTSGQLRLEHDLSRKRQPLRVLLVDNEKPVRQLLEHIADGQAMTLVQASGVEEARKVLTQQRIDLALVEPSINNGQGMALAGEIRQRSPRTHTIVISATPTMQQAIDSMRAGVCDFIPKPLSLTELNQRVASALAKRDDQQYLHQRLRKLRRMCKKLNQARVEVSEQVDVLCNDLVTAYQELANQMHTLVQTSEYNAVVEGELDLENLLRKTLEFLLKKAGPTNAVIFLPSMGDEYTVGAYINYDAANGSPEALLDHMADVVAPVISNQDGTLHLRDDEALEAWVGDDSAYLADCHTLSFPVIHEDEALACVILFRDASEPYPNEMVEVCDAVAPLFSMALAKIIRVHHRLHGDTPPSEAA